VADPATVGPQQPDDEGPQRPGDDEGPRHDDERADQALTDRQAPGSTASAMPSGRSSRPAPVRYAPLESDRWTLEDDFDRGALVDRIYQIVTQDPPLGTVGVYGGWGSGKSSIMRQVRRRLEEGWTGPDGQAVPGYFGTGARYVGPLAASPRGPVQIPDDYDRERGYRGTVWFSAWEHQKDIDPAVAMLQEARRMLHPSRLVRWRMKKWFKIVRNAIGTAGGTLERMGRPLSVVGAPLAAVHQSVERVNQDLYDVQEDQVRKKEAFTQIVRLLVRNSPRKRVIFFVDDLDRCDDAVARRLLDDIKTYLDQEQCVFVIGVNSAQLRAGRLRAGTGPGPDDGAAAGYAGRLPAGPGHEATGEDRLDKIIQYPFYVPMLAVDQYRRYLERTLRRKLAGGTSAGETAEAPASRASLEEVQVRAVAELLTDVLTARSTSLREVKRLVSVFMVNHELASHAFGETGLWGLYQPLVVAVLSAVQAFCPATFEWLSGRSDAQARMEFLFKGVVSPYENADELKQVRQGVVVLLQREGTERVPSEVLAELGCTDEMLDTLVGGSVCAAAQRPGRASTPRPADALLGGSVFTAARKVGRSLADETRLSLYLSMWGQTHQSTARQNSRWTTEWRARSDLSVRQVQHWIQGIGDDGQIEHEWTDDDLRVVRLGDWWWWVLDVKAPEEPNESYPEGRPRRALLLCEGLVATRPYAGNIDENGHSDFPGLVRWNDAGPGELRGVLWSESSLRDWLREDFAGRLPPDVRIEKEKVTTLTGWADGRGRLWEEKATSDSKDKGRRNDPATETVYLLEWEEIFGAGAPYRFGEMDVDAYTEGGLVGFWWLRSPGISPYDAWAVLPSALADPVRHINGLWAGARAGVRPAFWLNLESSIF